jgi:hypothetical protein
MATPGDNCDRHEREIERLRGQVELLQGELARRETIVVGLQHDVKALGDRVPPDFANWVGRTTVALENLNRGQNDVVQALREGYVTVAELQTARNEHASFAKRSDIDQLRLELEPIRAAFWKAASIIGATILLGLIGLLWEIRKLPPH